MSEDSYLSLQQLIETIRYYNHLLTEYERRLTRIEVIVYLLLVMNGLSILLSIFH
jgi:hypothetical protein